MVCQSVLTSSLLLITLYSYFIDSLKANGPSVLASKSSRFVLFRAVYIDCISCGSHRILMRHFVPRHVH